MKYLQFFAILATAIKINAVDRPDFTSSTARVKQHRFGPTGQLVEGEEDLRKVIVSWDHAPGAESYEICHNCDNIDEATGEETGDLGTILPIPAGQECGARPCMIMPDAPIGYNKFHLRVMVGGEWSVWSVHQNFNVDEVGMVMHEEL